MTGRARTSLLAADLLAALAKGIDQAREAATMRAREAEPREIILIDMDDNAGRKLTANEFELESGKIMQPGAAARRTYH